MKARKPNTTAPRTAWPRRIAGGAGLVAGLAGVVLPTLVLPACAPGLEAIDRETEARMQAAAGDAGTQFSPEMPDVRARYSGKYFVEDSPTLRKPTTTNPAAQDLAFVDRKARELETQAVIDRMKAMGTIAHDAQVFTLAGALEQAFAHSFDYRVAEEQYVLAALRLLSNEHVFALIPSTDVATAIRSVDGRNFGIGGLDADRFNTAVTLANNLALTQRLPYGGRVTAALATTLTEQLANAVGDTTQLGSFLTLSAEIPLLRGAGLVAQEDLIQAQRNLVYSARSFEDFRRRYLLTIVRGYLDLVVRQQIISNSTQQVERLRQIEQREQALVAAGRQVPFQADLASQRTLFAVDRLSEQEEAYRLAVDQFKVQIGVDADTPVRIEPEMLDLPIPAVTPDQAVRAALDFRLDVQNLRDQLEDLKRQVDVARNGLLPDLRLTGSLVQPVGSTSYDNVVNTDFEGTDARAGIIMTIPLDQTNEQIALRQAQVILETGARNYVNFRDEAATQVRAAVREIDRSLFSYRLSERNIKIALNRQGSIDAAPDRAQPRDRTDAVEALASALNSRDQAKRDLQLAVLAYLVASGQMRVDKTGIPQLPAGKPLVIQKGDDLAAPLQAPPV
ncbi:MAG: TolC family protein [Phycisphaerae bacterium]|nr:TolC family protein [Phycisphaerae bacterium]